MNEGKQKRAKQKNIQDKSKRVNFKALMLYNEVEELE